MIGVAVVVFVLIQAVLYPAAIGIKDEGTYLSQAYVFRSGTIFADAAGTSLWAGVNHASHIVAKYPPGESLLVLPATLVGWRLTFAITIVLQIIGSLLFVAVLRRFGIRSGWAPLYLLFPALVLFSRTLMPDVPSATLTLAAMLCYFVGRPRERILAGLLLGLSVFLHYSNLVTLGLLMLAAGWKNRQSLRSLKAWRISAAAPTQVLVGSTPMFAVLIAYNVFAYGRPFGYGADAFALQYVLPHLKFYAIDLLLLYPLMLAAPFLYSGPFRLEIRVLTLGFLAAMCAYYYIDNTHGFAENLLTGARLLIPTFPLWLLAYAQVLDRLFSRSHRAYMGAAIGATALGLTLATAVAFAHERHLSQAANIRDLIYLTTRPNDVFLINDETTKFINPAWGGRAYTVIGGSAVRLTPVGTDSARRVDVIYAAQGSADGAGLRLAEASAASLGASPVVDETLSDWRVIIWTTGTSS